MPILTKSGRIVIAESIALRPLHVAWGIGDGAWSAPPSEDSNATTLIQEIGRRTVTEVGFASLDPAGDIILPTGARFVRSVTPTNNLYLRTAFDFSEASGAVIRQIGVFAGTTFVSGLPSGQQYFSPSEVATAGRLLHLENFVPIYRAPAIRESFEVVITF